MKKLDRYIDIWDMLEIDWPDTEKRKVGGDLFKKLNRAFSGLFRGQVAK